MKPLSPSYPMGTGGRAVSTGAERPRREVDHSSPSNAEVKNAWSYTFTPPYVFTACCLIKHRMRLHGVVLS
jgi:hypothetical protein